MDIATQLPAFWFVPLPKRTELALLGADRTAILHNFCTQDIKKLAPGQGAEAFITTHQGKTLGFVNVLVSPEELLLDTVPGQAEVIRQHLDRFIISEQVNFEDRSAGLLVYWVGGTDGAERLASFLGVQLPQNPLQHEQIPWQSCSLKVVCGRKAELPYWFVMIPSAKANEFRNMLAESKATELSAEMLTQFRLLANLPEFGSEVLNDNLPQEIDRDALTISFKKGCYLGQETVARLDALGHVNRVLRRIRFAKPTAEPTSADLFVGDKQAGKVLTATKPFAHGEVWAFAMVKRLNAKPGTELSSAVGQAIVY
ncbi:MAG: YgfZ/GcvT domain-containing protein [Planctomycetaceae bacterium]